MKHGPLVFLAAFFALSLSWCGFVLAPQIQIGRDVQSPAAGELYPPAPAGVARQGAEVYRANGCFYCHTMQVRQTGIECNLILDDVGTNVVAVRDALAGSRAGVMMSAPALAGGLPKTIVHGATIELVTSVAAALKAAGAKTEVDLVPLGPDISRGWGNRRTVAQDFLYEDVVMPGSQRIGPDLANVGLRRADENWQLVHLYAPQVAVKGSAMPPYRFLFEKRKLEHGRPPSPDAVQFPEGAPSLEGFEIVPKPEAKALAAYLVSLRASVPLYEAPMNAPPAPASSATTNAPVK